MAMGNLFDGLLLGLLAICVFVWPTQQVTDNQNRWLRIVAVGLVAFQLLVEGPRLQLLPAYLVGALFSILLIAWHLGDRQASAIRESNERFTKKLARWTLIGSTSFVLFLSALLCVCFPRYQYPAPSGRYAVGIREFQLVDSSRTETETARPDDRRELGIRVSYPSDATPADKLERDFIEDRVAIAAYSALLILKPDSKWRAVVPRSWERIVTNAWRDAPLAKRDRPYPVLIYSHGLGSWPEQNTILIEELASRGYIVFAINHAGLSSGITRMDGSTVDLGEFMRRSNTLAKMTPISDEIGKRSRELNSELSNPALDVSLRAKLIKESSMLRPGPTEATATAHGLAADDHRFLLDYLATDEALFKEQLDLNRIGILGMSMGGTAAHITCARDPRCRAGVNMDGYQALLIDVPLTVPFMHMSNARFHNHAVSHRQANGPSYLVKIGGTVHGSFHDMAYSTPMLRLLDSRGINVVGQIDGERMMQILNAYVPAFFDKHLLGNDAPLLDGTSERFPEVSLSSK
jgi:predicted dienelactone hydrolase